VLTSKYTAELSTQQFVIHEEEVAPKSFTVVPKKKEGRKLNINMEDEDISERRIRIRM
jgi:hypothetical protein